MAERGTMTTVDQQRLETIIQNYETRTEHIRELQKQALWASIFQIVFVVGDDVLFFVRRSPTIWAFDPVRTVSGPSSSCPAEPSSFCPAHKPGALPARGGATVPRATLMGLLRSLPPRRCTLPAPHGAAHPKAASLRALHFL